MPAAKKTTLFVVQRLVGTVWRTADGKNLFGNRRQAEARRRELQRRHPGQTFRVSEWQPQARSL
jgi:hypothetical protein